MKGRKIFIGLIAILLLTVALSYSIPELAFGGVLLMFGMAANAEGEETSENQIKDSVISGVKDFFAQSGKTMIDNFIKESEYFKSVVNKPEARESLTKGISVEEGNAFIKAIVYGRELPEVFRSQYEGKNYMNETTGTAGAYTVPQEMYKKIQELLFAQSVARQNCQIFKMSHKELYLPKLNTLPSWSFVAEGGLKSISNPSFQQAILTRHDGGFIITFSKQLLEDSAFDLMGFVSNMASKVMANFQDRCLFKGYPSIINGIMQDGNPNGLNAEYLVSDDLNLFSYDAILNVMGMVPSETLKNAKWYMHRSIWAMIKKLKYPDVRIGSPSDVAGWPQYVLSGEDRTKMTLEGYPVILSDGAYSTLESASNRGFIVFGDLNYVALGERHDLTVDYSREATISIEGGQTLNLWQQGLVGLNFGASFDIKTIYPTALGVIMTPEV